jgi:hypothetical protein
MSTRNVHQLDKPAGTADVQPNLESGENQTSQMVDQAIRESAAVIQTLMLKVKGNHRNN